MSIKSIVSSSDVKSYDQSRMKSGNNKKEKNISHIAHSKLKDQKIADHILLSNNEPPSLEKFFSSYSCLSGILEQEVKKNSKKVLRKKDELFPEPKQYISSATSGNETIIFKLAKAKNRPNKKGSKIAAHPPIQISSSEKRVRNKTYNEEVVFDSPGGICKGMSIWFLRMYLETKSEFSDVRNHMIALGEQFAKGGGAGPVFLHALFVSKGKIFNLNIGSQDSGSKKIEPTHAFRFSSEGLERDKKRKRIIDSFNDLPLNTYLISGPGHAMVFIKIDDELGFFFDPNHGLYEILGPEQAEVFFELVTKDFEGEFKMHPVSLRTKNLSQ